MTLPVREVKAHLRDSFRLLAEVTGNQDTDVKMHLYASHIADSHLPLADVITAIRDLLTTWQKPFWPSPEAIVAKARETSKRRRAAHGITAPSEAEVEREAAILRDQQWDRRRGEAEIFCEAHPEICHEIIAGVDADIARAILAGRSPKLADNRVYRNAYRAGAIVSGLLKRSGEWERRHTRQLLPIDASIK